MSLDAKRQNKLNKILKERGLDNQKLVNASTLQLTFKQVQKARLNRPVTVNIQDKIIRALNACVEDLQYQRRDLFDQNGMNV